jgi:ATP-binding cassette, subfamily C (CFTR/MRP), member 1
LLRIPQEAESRLPIPQTSSKKPWMSDGKIEFCSYSVKYRPDTEIVLNDISITINPREKIGVVGRTGAGKSTLCIAICRIIERQSGCIKIDGIDINTLGLADLRSQITIIPQEATLFNGTLRFNLDPEGRNEDEEIMRLLNKAGLTDLFLRDGNGLDLQIDSKGENLSSGEKQLICICRAILRVSF